MAQAAGATDLQTPPQSATITHAPVMQTEAVSAQPRKVGGFVLEEDDAEEEALHANTGFSGPNYSQNRNGGSLATSQQASLALQSPSTSRPQSTTNLPSVPDDIADQNTSDIARIRTTDIAVAHGSGDVLSSPSVPLPNQVSARNTPVNAHSQSRPPTAQGMVQSPGATMSTSARLPNDRVGMLEDRVRDDPKGDTEAWLSLIEEHKRRNKVSEVRATYERFLEVFPTTVSWLRIPLHASALTCS